MDPTRRCRELVVCAVVAAPGCAWLPPDHPPVGSVPQDPDAALVHDWKIIGHVLGPRALISDLDAAGFQDRTVAVTRAGYVSPWSGTCDDARREKQPRALGEVADAHELARDRAQQLELAGPIVEYQLMCATNRAPPLQIYVAGAHAVSCWSGVCYLLAR